MNEYEGNQFINIGVGKDISIKELAEKVKQVVGFKGAISFNTSKLDGTPRKLVDVTRLNELGWKASISLDEGLKKAYEWFLNNTDATVVAK
jgi:GDP-L-fucose synthase